MAGEIISETFRRLIRSSKNRLFMVMVFLGIILYSVVLLPNSEPMKTVDMERLEIEMLANKGLMESRLESGQTEANLFTGQSTYQMAKNKYQNQRAFKAAIDNGDAHRVIQLNYLPEYQQKEIRDDYLANSEAPLKDMNYDETNDSLRLNSYIEDIPEDITFHLIQEKTAWQQIHQFLLNWGPIVILIGTVFLASDVLTGDRLARTQKAGVPYNWRKYIFLQSLTVFGFVLLFFAAAFGFFMLLNGMLYGVGSLDLKVPLYTYSRDYVTNDNVYGLMTIGFFLAGSLPFLFGFIYLMIRLSALFSLYFKQDVVVLVAGVFTIVFEKLYYSRRMRDILGIDLSFFPQTYIDFGKVVSGEKNFLLNTPTITVERGLVVVGVTLLVIEAALWVSTKYMTRQRFVR